VSDWVVLELTPRSEGEDPDLIRRSIRNTLKRKDIEVFVPAAVTQVGDDRVVHYLVEGYVFVRHESSVDYLRLEGSRFVQTVLSTGVRRKALSTVRDVDINRMRAQIAKQVDQGIGVGDTVMISSGAYRHIEATVIEEILETQTVQVHVKLRSKETIVTLPRSFLQVVKRTPLSTLFSRLTALRAWTRMVQPILTWTRKNPPPLKRRFNRLNRFEKWVTKAHHLRAFVGFYHGSLGRGPQVLRQQLAKTEQLSVWDERAKHLRAFVLFHYRDMQLDVLGDKLVELYWFDDVLERMKILEGDIERLGHRVARRRKSGGGNVVQNILVDGHNLAFRCLYAPGMATLADEQGRPTGMILGFLRSLGALKKRFAEARLYVSWDGSSQRRKTLYGEYKANRTSASASHGVEGFDQVGFLREILPKFGCWQVYNPEEEADDVIAVLARGPLKTQHNLIFSTDKDMLALVTSTTSVLTPKVGTRKEILHDPTSVAKLFGVPPEQLQQLRAFCGDPSDNIPGVPRVPKKVLRSLVQQHGSVQGVYGSGLTGLSKGQYERLRTAEPQVRLNLRLMAFANVEVLTVDPDPDVEGAAAKLHGVGINPTPILKPFGG